MALDESTENMDMLESNGVTAYIDKALNQHLVSAGDINIDYIEMENGPSGYRIVIGENKCGDGSCHCE
jgi:Fe-S cluster assembly iron-binding protein IscA